MIPVIDFAPARAGDYARAGAALDAALRETGFCYLANHGIPAHVIAAAMRHSLAYFHLPQDSRAFARPLRALQVNGAGRNGKGPAAIFDSDEHFEMGPEPDGAAISTRQFRWMPHPWPSDVPELRAALGRFHDEAARCGAALMRSLASALGTEVDFFDRRFQRPFHRTRAVHYPSQPRDLEIDPEQLSAQTDPGCVTLLWQDRLGALDLRTCSGQWLEALPVAGTLIVFAGDLLQRWSEDRYISTRYRRRRFKGHARLSIASFYDPDYGAVIDPSELSVRRGRRPHYAPILAGDFIMSRLATSLDLPGGGHEP